MAGDLEHLTVPTFEECGFHLSLFAGQDAISGVAEVSLQIKYSALTFDLCHLTPIARC